MRNISWCPCLNTWLNLQYRNELCPACRSVTSDIIKYKASLVTSCLGCINVLLTNPLWVVNSRLKMAGIKNEVQKYKGTLDGLIKIAMEVNTLYITIVTML